MIILVLAAATYLVGFEAGARTGDASQSISSACTYDTAVKRTGTYALKCALTAAAFFRTNTGVPNNQSVVYLRFYFRLTSHTVGTNAMIYAGVVGGTISGSISLNGSEQLILRDDANAIVGTGSTALNLDQWYRIELFKSGADPGTYTLWLDGSQQVTSATADANGILDNMIFGNNNASQTYTAYWDDVRLDDAALPGAGQIEILTVNGAGSLTEFDTTSGSATHWQNVDEIPPVDTSDYNRHAGASIASDLYAVLDTASTGITGTINAVQANWRMYRSAGAATLHQGALVENATQTNTTLTLGTAADSFVLAYSTPPNSGGSWTSTKLDSLEIGGKHADTGAQDTTITWAAFMVDYTPGGGPPPAAVPMRTLMGVGQ